MRLDAACQGTSGRGLAGAIAACDSPQRGNLLKLSAQCNKRPWTAPEIS